MSVVDWQESVEWMNDAVKRGAGQTDLFLECPAQRQFNASVYTDMPA
jgi:hypothetical protein